MSSPSTISLMLASMWAIVSTSEQRCSSFEDRPRTHLVERKQILMNVRVWPYFKSILRFDDIPTPAASVCGTHCVVYVLGSRDRNEGDNVSQYTIFTFEQILRNGSTI